MSKAIFTDWMHDDLFWNSLLYLSLPEPKQSFGIGYFDRLSPL
jgi:hypothetical protein